MKPLDATGGAVAAEPTAAARIDALNARYGSMEAEEALRRVLRGPFSREQVALVSSFGAESAVLLALVSKARPEIPVLFIDTEFLFAETLDYQRALADRLGLTNVRRLTPAMGDVALRDPDRTLHQRDVDACCALRKTRPLQTALGGFDAWISGRKRFQNGARQALRMFEADAAGRIKMNPLAAWSSADLKAFMAAENLPPHPLVAQGYPSIGCAPCTTPVAAGEDPRAGRWRGSGKTECGIHVVGGRLMRTGAAAKDAPQTRAAAADATKTIEETA